MLEKLQAIPKSERAGLAREALKNPVLKIVLDSLLEDAAEYIWRVESHDAYVRCVQTRETIHRILDILNDCISE